MFSTTTPQIGKQLYFCKYLSVEDKLFLIKMSRVDSFATQPRKVCPGGSRADSKN